MSIRSSAFVATSLDGFIARPDGSIDWLNEANKAVPPGEVCGYNEFISSVDILVTGRNTFEQALSFKEWDAMAGDFQKSLDKFKVPTAEQKDLFEVVGKTKVDIVTMKQSGNHWSGDGCATMRSGLELYDSRVSRIDLADGVANIYFSHACIYKSKAVWSQEAELVLLGATMPAPLPPLPNTISAGFLEVGGIRHELIPLPFKRKVAARLYLQFVDGTEIEIVGEKPILELLGRPIHLEDFS